MQAGANAGWPTITVGLKAPNEGDVNQWKRFDANAVLSVTYNSYPSIPDTLTVDGAVVVDATPSVDMARMYPGRRHRSTTGDIAWHRG